MKATGHEAVWVTDTEMKILVNKPNPVEDDISYLERLTEKLITLSPEATKRMIQDLRGKDSIWVFIDVLDGEYDS